MGVGRDVRRRGLEIQKLVVVAAAGTAARATGGTVVVVVIVVAGAAGGARPIIVVRVLVIVVVTAARGEEGEAAARAVLVIAVIVVVIVVGGAAAAQAVEHLLAGGGRLVLITVRIGVTVTAGDDGVGFVAVGEGDLALAGGDRLMGHALAADAVVGAGGGAADGDAAAAMEAEAQAGIEAHLARGDGTGREEGREATTGAGELGAAGAVRAHQHAEGLLREAVTDEQQQEDQQ